MNIEETPESNKETSHSQNLNELITALSKVQGEMKAAEKNSSNTFHKNKYADLASVWEAIRVSLSANGLCVMQLTDALPGRGLTLITMLCHSSGQWVKSFIPLKPAKEDSQGIGGAMTYMRRYALCALLGVVADEDIDDDGETAVGRGKYNKSKTIETPKPENVQQYEPIATLSTNNTPINKDQLKELMEKYGYTDEAFRKKFREVILKDWHSHELWQIPAIHYDTCMQGIANNLDKNKKN